MCYFLFLLLEKKDGVEECQITCLNDKFCIPFDVARQHKDTSKSKFVKHKKKTILSQ